MGVLARNAESERGAMLVAEFDGAARACRAAKAKLRFALLEMRTDLDHVAQLADEVALQASRLAGFARMLKRERENH